MMSSIARSIVSARQHNRYRYHLVPPLEDPRHFAPRITLPRCFLLSNGGQSPNRALGRILLVAKGRRLYTLLLTEAKCDTNGVTASATMIIKDVVPWRRQPQFTVAHVSTNEMLKLNGYAVPKHGHPVLPFPFPLSPLPPCKKRRESIPLLVHWL